MLPRETSRPARNRRLRPRGPKSARGFTLIETAIAMVVMMIAALGAASLFMYAMKYNSNAKDRELAMAVAQRRIERLRTVPFTSGTRNLAYTSGGLGQTAAAGVTETTTNGGRPYQVVTTITDVAFDTAATPQPTLKRITISVTPTGAGNVLGAVTVTTLRATVVKGLNN